MAMNELTYGVFHKQTKEDFTKHDEVPAFKMNKEIAAYWYNMDDNDKKIWLQNFEKKKHAENYKYLQKNVSPKVQKQETKPIQKKEPTDQKVSLEAVKNKFKASEAPKAQKESTKNKRTLESFDEEIRKLSKKHIADYNKQTDQENRRTTYMKWQKQVSSLLKEKSSATYQEIQKFIGAIWQELKQDTPNTSKAVSKNVSVNSSNYQQWYRKEYAQQKENFPTRSTQEIARLVGLIWKQKKILTKKKDELDMKKKKLEKNEMDQNIKAQKARNKASKITISKKKGKAVVNGKEVDVPVFPNSSYIYFQQDKKKELQKKHTNWTAKQVMTKIAELWRSAGESEKKTYKQKYDKAKKSFFTAKDEFIKKYGYFPKKESQSIRKVNYNISKVQARQAQIMTGVKRPVSSIEQNQMNVSLNPKGPSLPVNNQQNPLNNLMNMFQFIFTEQTKNAQQHTPQNPCSNLFNKI